MANINIQDIESVDDYWGPTFKQILEASGSYDKVLEQLENRIKTHDKEIEKICNLYYQGFIESTKDLLQVRSQAKALNDEVSSFLLKELGSSMSTCLSLTTSLIHYH